MDPADLLERLFPLWASDPEPAGEWVLVGDDLSFVPCEHDHCDH